MIITRFNGGPVGIDTIAASIGEERITIEDAYEPYLIQQGCFIERRRAEWLRSLPISTLESPIAVTKHR